MTATPVHRATEDIFVAPGVRAFRAGDVVPASMVDMHKDKVARESTKAVKDVLPKP